MSQKTITLQGSDAINVSDVSKGGTVGSITLSSGKYAVNLESSVNFHYDIAKLDQVVLYNCAPLNTNNSESWYSVVDTTKGIQINAQENQPIYAMILDQMNTSDNTGSMTITFTPIP